VPRGVLLALLGGLIAASLAAPARAQVLTQIQLVGYSTSALSSTSATSYSVTVPAGVLVGDFMLFVGSNNPGTNGGSPSGWTYLASNITGNTTGPLLGFSLWYRIATSADVAGSTVYTWTVTGSSRVGGAISAFRGVDNTNPVVGFSSSNACTYTTGVGCATSATSSPSTTRTAPSLTPGVANSTLVAVYSASDGTADTPTAPTGTTQIFAAGTADGANGLLLSAFYERFANATASGTFLSTGSTSAESVGGTVALQPATVSPSAYWHFDQTAWTGTAGEVIDSGGSGYNAVAAHSATTSGTTPALSGSPGTCNYGGFNGTTQYVEMPSSLPHVGNEFTITAWIRPTANQVGRIWLDDENYNGSSLGGYGLSFYDSGSAKMRMYSRLPSSVYVDSNITLSLNTWYFVTLVTDVTLGQAMYMIIFDSAGNRLDTTSVTRSSFSAGTGAHATVGGSDDGETTSGNVVHFAGNIDEVTIFAYDLPIPSLQAWEQTTHPCPTYNVPNHYAVSTPGTAVNCAPAAVTITAHSSTHAAIATTDTIAITTSTNHGDWTLTSGSGTFTASGSDAGTASYTYTSADAGVVTLALRDTHAETLTVGVTDTTNSGITATSGTATASEDSPLTFVASGFIVTNGANVATTIGTQVAGVTSTQSLALQAVRTDTKTGACTSVFANGQTVNNIGIGYQCNNPTTCITGQTLKLTNNGATTTLLSNPNSTLSNYQPVSLKFSTANAEAPFTLVYSDVGQITLAVKYAIPLGSGAPSGTTMLGASQFVVQPYTLVLSNIIRTSNSFANPAASTASGTVFLPAGQSFTATVTAYSSPGTVVTPNFGQETSPASVTMATNQVLSTAVGGSDFPAVSGSFGTYTSGAASGTAFSWPEAGIMTITPSVAYLGSGTVTGTTTGNVGRFIPNNFATAWNTTPTPPQFAAACVAGGFTYLGQPFIYSTAPILTVTAQALSGATTLNYAGSLFRLTNGSLTGRTYTPTPASPALTTTGLPPTTSDPTIASQGLGVGTLTFSAGTGLLFTRGTPIAPFGANIALSINVIDQDNVVPSATAGGTNPITLDASTGIPFTTTTGNNQYYGRLALRDSLGSELLDLPMPLTTQYYVSTSAGFATNTSDSCTAGPTITFSSWQTPLTSAQTCVRDAGKPGVSGQGCSTSTSGQYAATAVSGAFNFIIAAPGAGYSGAVTVTPTAPTWLQYPWNNGSNTNPVGMATFGVFPGSPTRIYQREVY
jgi:MSHA biogenesis protein MshQ